MNYKKKFHFKFFGKKKIFGTPKMQKVQKNKRKFLF